MTLCNSSVNSISFVHVLMSQTLVVGVITCARKTSDKHNNKYLQSPTVTLTWHACKYKVHKLHQKYIIEDYLHKHHQRYNLDDVPRVEFMYLVFTPVPGESYCRRLKSLLL